MRHRRPSKRQLTKRHMPAIGLLTERMSELSDMELRKHTARFRSRLSAGELVDGLLPEAFAVVGEASWRVCGHRCSPDDLRAGLALHGRSVVEVQDPPAAAAAVTLVVYLSALNGRGVHLMTGDGAPWTTEVCRFLGLTVAALAEDLDGEERRAAYAADVTVGPYAQFCYDYLTDNRVSGPGERVQRGLRHAVATEADHVLLAPGR